MASKKASSLRAWLDELCNGRGVWADDLYDRLGPELRDKWHILEEDRKFPVRVRAIVSWQIEQLISRIPESRGLRVQDRTIARVAFNVSISQIQHLELTARYKWLDNSSHPDRVSARTSDRRIAGIYDYFTQLLEDEANLPSRGQVRAIAANPQLAVIRDGSINSPYNQEAVSHPARYPDASAGQAALAAIPRRNRKQLALVITAGAGVCVLIAIVAIAHFTSSPSAHTARLFSIITYTDPDDMKPPGSKAVVPTSGEFLFPRGKLTSLTPPDGNVCSLYGWAHRHGAIDLGNSGAAAQITALTSATVQIVGLRMHVQPMARSKAKGDVMSCEQGNPPTVSVLSIDLDEQTATFDYAVNGQVQTDAPFLVNIEHNKPERIYVFATSHSCYCKWTLDLHIQVGAKEYWQRMDNNGEPFVTAPIDGTYRYYTWYRHSWSKF